MTRASYRRRYGQGRVTSRRNLSSKTGVLALTVPIERTKIDTDRVIPLFLRLW